MRCAMYELRAAGADKTRRPAKGRENKMFEAFMLGATIGAFVVAGSVGYANSNFEKPAPEPPKQTVYIFGAADGITTAADLPETEIVTPEN